MDDGLNGRPTNISLFINIVERYILILWWLNLVNQKDDWMHASWLYYTHLLVIRVHTKLIKLVDRLYRCHLVKLDRHLG